jgi:phosphoglycerate dehydrogenase-like enzyme
MPRLRYIGSTCHYRQAEFVDVAAALARGIAFSETAPIMSPWVAEYEFALGLAALRRIPQEHGIVGDGGWVANFFGDPPAWPDRLQGRRVGLASFGEIHRHLARYLAPFECDWQAYDPFVPAERIESAGGRKAEDLVEMARRSEMLFIATPPNPRTIGLIGREVIEALPDGAVFVLVSRMAVVEQAPLIERLRRNELRAAIDVYEPEPPESDSPLRTLPNVIHTPHRAGNTAGAHRGVFTAQCEEARRHFAGEPLTYPLRPELVALFSGRA